MEVGQKIKSNGVVYEIWHILDQLCIVKEAKQ